MKRNYIFKGTIAFVFLAFSSAAVSSQVRGFDEFMMNPDDFGPVGNSSNNSGPEIADFSFASSSTFDVALANQILWNLARQQLRTAWFNKQKNLIKEHIEDKFNEIYPTYEVAREKLFLDSEIKNVLRNVVEPRTRYQNLRSQGFGIQRQQLQDLKLLDIRENEINAGNINNPQYGFIKIDDTYLKDITSINQIEQFRGPIIPLFEENTATTHENNYIYLKLNNLGEGIHQEALDLKKGYYNGFEDWTKLNYMQFLIQYEEIKRLTTAPYYYPNLLNLMNQFIDTDQATSQMIETYARSNRDGGYSIFSHAYFQHLLYIARTSGGNQYVDYSDMYASVQEDWEQQKGLELDSLVDNTNTSTYAILNLIGELDISNSAQKAWLHDSNNHNQVKKIMDFLDIHRVNLTVSDEIKSFTIMALNLLMEINGLDFETVEKVLTVFNNTCQGDILFNALYVNSPFLNSFRSLLLTPENNHILLQSAASDQTGLADLTASTSLSLFDAHGYTDLVVVTFYQDYLNTASDLALIVTLYHELLHAKIVDLYYEGQLLTTYPTYTNLKNSFDDYIQDPNPFNANNLQQEMHNIYVDFIDELAQSIFQYCQDNNIDGVDLNYAKKLVWGSLGAYDVFTNNLTPSEQSEALTLLNNEQQNNSNAISKKTCD